MITLSNENALDVLREQLQALLAALSSGLRQPRQAQLSLSFVLSGFPENSSVLTSDQEAVLEQLQMTLLGSPSEVVDNEVVRLIFEIDELVGRASQTGAEANNVELSRERAEAVRDWLAVNGLYTIPTLIYHGSSQPLVDAARNELAINRSVEIRILVGLDISALEAELDHWEPVFVHTVPPAIEAALEDRGIQIQGLDTADAIMMDPRLNLDYYQVRITEMPQRSNGHPYTMEELFREIRLNLSDIISSEQSTENPFRPDFMIYDDTGSERNLQDFIGPFLSKAVTEGAHAGFRAYSAEDATVWQSDNPLGAVMQFDSYGDDMGVVCSAYGGDYWVFTTVGDSPLPGLGDVGSHPVSGHRKFGFRQDSSGHYLVYTQGADRTTSTFETAMGELVFGGGHIIWLAWQVGIHQFVISRGGKADILKPLSNRSSYGEALEHFTP